MMSLKETTKTNLETAQPMWKLVLTQFAEHRMAVFGSFIILFFLTVAILADGISSVTGLDPNRQNVSSRYLQPFSRAENSNDAKETAIDQFTKAFPEDSKNIENLLLQKKLSQAKPEDVLFEFTTKSNAEVVKILKDLNSPSADKLATIFKSFDTYHVFGTDEVGRDVFIRLVYGARISLGVGIMVALASAFIGLMMGSLAGFYGGTTDVILMRVTDALLSIPQIPILIILAAIDLHKIPFLGHLVHAESESIFKMFLILGSFSWMTVARLVRGSILSLREREFILASKTLGATDSTIIVRHMFPNVIAPLVVSITLGVGQSILAEAALSFLGLGIMPPTPSWGNMLTNAQEMIYKNVWLAILPGIMIFLTTISFNFVGDGLQDAVDPKTIRR